MRRSTSTTLFIHFIAHLELVLTMYMPYWPYEVYLLKTNIDVLFTAWAFRLYLDS